MCEVIGMFFEANIEAETHAILNSEETVCVVATARPPICPPSLSP